MRRGKRKRFADIDERFEIVLVVFLLVAALVLINVSPTGYLTANTEIRERQVSHEAFAKCMTKNGIALYTDSNQASNKQLEMFGEGANFLDVVNCRTSREFCNSRGVGATPLWDIYGERHVGIIPLGDLSDITGCKL